MLEDLAADLGLADLLVLIMARQFDTHRLLSLDERDFPRRDPRSEAAPFTLLPADA